MDVFNLELKHINASLADLKVDNAATHAEIMSKVADVYDKVSEIRIQLAVVKTKVALISAAVGTAVSLVVGAAAAFVR